MLSTLDTSVLLEEAASRGWQGAEVFAECVEHWVYDANGRVESVTRRRDERLELTAFGAGPALRLVTTSLDPEPLLARLKGTTPTTLGQKIPGTLRPVEPSKDCGILGTAYRYLLSEGAPISFPSLRFHRVEREFQVSTLGGASAPCHERSAEARAEWLLDLPGKMRVRQVEELGSAEPERLLQEIEATNPFLGAMRRSVSLTNPWPCPTGEVPIRWAPRAVAKLMFLFTRSQPEGIWRGRARLRRLKASDAFDPAEASLDWGLAVHDVRVLGFDPRSGEVSLEATQSRLVHQNEEGEWIEPFRFSTHLAALLRGLRRLPSGDLPVGLGLTRRQSRFLVEITAPPALTFALSIRGSVPLSHYW